MSDVNISVASRQWATRPDDQRYLSLEELHKAVMTRKNESWTATPTSGQLNVVPLKNDDLGVEVFDPTVGGVRTLIPSNWSFGQLAGYAGAPATYLRKLPNELAAINLQWGLEHNPQREDALVLARSNGEHVLRSMTSTTYGRIWDHQVVEAVQKANADGRWQIPAASYATTNPKRASTLYASDRDIFLFLVDPKNAIEIDGKPLFRGFYTWNSEVGAATFGLATFLYEYVCDNRTIWGATNVNELRIRHSRGAPERFAYEGQKYLARYANESTDLVVKAITAAKNKDLHTEINSGKGETVADWMTKKGFTKGQANASIEAAVVEEGEARSLWSIIRGVTAYARTIPHTNDRVEVEQRAGKLLDLVS